MSGTNITLTGHRGLIKLLRQLPDDVYRKVVKKANDDVMRPVLREAKKLTPSATGTLRRSLGIKTKLYPRRGVVFTLVGPRLGFGRKVSTGGGKSGFREPTKYAHMVEDGHRIARGGTTLRRNGESRFQAWARAKAHGKKVAEHTGHVTPVWYLRRAWNGQKMTMFERYKAQLRVGILREAKRLGHV